MTYKEYLKILVALILSSIFSSCNFIYRNKTRWKQTTTTYPPFKPKKTDSLLISSISVVCRKSYGTPFYEFNRAGVVIDTNCFEQIVEGIKELAKKTQYKVDFYGDSIIQNDSLYKPLLNDINFSSGFCYNQLDSLNFSEQVDGLHLVVTVIKEEECVPGWQTSCNYDIALIYDFFEIKTGAIVAHTIILRNRNASYPQNGARCKPLPRDARRVFKKLYKVGKKDTN